MATGAVTDRAWLATPAARGERAVVMAQLAALNLVRPGNSQPLVDWLTRQTDPLPTSTMISVVVELVGRTEAPVVINDLREAGVLTQRAATDLVWDAWVNCEWPMRQVDRADWVDLFRYGGYVVNGTRRARPRKPVRLYRGAGVEYHNGLSWTPDRSVAELFALRTRLYAKDPDGRVWTVLAPPEALLAKGIHGHDRSREPEVVVDTDGLEITPAD